MVFSPLIITVAILPHCHRKQKPPAAGGRRAANVAGASVCYRGASRPGCHVMRRIIIPKTNELVIEPSIV